MKEKTLEQEIELLVNFYSKPGDKEALTAAINRLIERYGSDNGRE